MFRMEIAKEHHARILKIIVDHVMNKFLNIPIHQLFSDFLVEVKSDAVFGSRFGDGGGHMEKCNGLRV